MSTEHYADMVRDILRRRAIEAPHASPRVHPPMVQAAERALRARRRRRRMVRFGAVTGAVAALALGIGGAGRLFFGGPGHVQMAMRETAPAPSGTARHETVLPVGAQLVSPDDSELRLSTADGSDLILEPSSVLTVLESGAVRRYGLRRGAVRVHVAKLHAGERFLVATDDAEVEVRGTIFRVALATSDASCPHGSLTRVSVEEGVVSVRHGGIESRLIHGDKWPARCDALALAGAPRAARPTSPGVVEPLTDEALAVRGSDRRDNYRHVRRRGPKATTRGWRAVANAHARATEPTEAPALAGGVSDGEGLYDGAGAGAGSGHVAAVVETSVLPVEDVAVTPNLIPLSVPHPVSAARAPDVAVVVPRSELAAQNEMYALALVAKRRHRPSSAIRLLTQFLQRYPSSPLTESARAQRMELLAAVESPEAPRAARDYLARYPDGFARVEARRVAGASSP